MKITIRVILSFFFAVIFGLDVHSEELAPADFWRAFRQTTPFPLQDVIASPISPAGRAIVILTEPPTRLWKDRQHAIEVAFGDKLVAADVHTWGVGFDGWVKDIVVTLQHMDERGLREGVRSLAQAAYGTDYGASYRTFEAHRWDGFAEPRRHLAPPNLQINAASLNDWLFQSPQLFSARTEDSRGAALSLAALFDRSDLGVFHSDSPGLVLLIIDRTQSLNDVAAQLRQFCLDSDALLGAVSKEDSSKLVIVGRERRVSVTDMPPLRVDTILTLAAATEENLAQSYERMSALAGASFDPDLVNFVAPPVPTAEPGHREADRYPLATAVDWAPILLSRELTGTEYGQLLNITDQLLKGWSEGNLVAYGNFPYPVPGSTPNPNGIFDRLRTTFGSNFDSLTFNWNTSGFGTWTGFGQYQIFSMLNSGALPISYIPSLSKSDLDDTRRGVIRKAEDEYWAFYAEQRNPDLNRAAQYAALHVIFSRFPVQASRTEPLMDGSVYERRWDPLKDAVALRVRGLAKSMNPDRFPDPPTPLDTRAHAATKPWSWPNPEGRMPWPDTKAMIAYYASDDQALAALATVMVEPRLLSSVLAIWQAQLLADAKSFNEKVRTHNELIRSCRPKSYVPGCESLGANSSLLEFESKRLDGGFDGLARAESSLRALIADGRKIRPLLSDPFDDAWVLVPLANEDVSDSVIKTPSIVGSTDVLGLMSGGHNLDGRSLRIVADPQVRAGSFLADENGNVLHLNPADMPKSANVGRDFERNRVEFLSGDAAAKRQVENRITAGLRSDSAPVRPFQPAVLALDEAAPGTRRLGADPTRTLVGRYSYAISEPQLARANAVAAQTEADLVAGWDGRTYSLIDPGPPPVGVAIGSPADMLRLIEAKAIQAAQSGRGGQGYVVVSDGSLSMAELDGMRVSGRTRQLVADAGGNGGGLPPEARVGMFFEEPAGPGQAGGGRGGGGSDGPGQPRGPGDGSGRPPGSGGEARRSLLAFPFSARASRALRRTDANWAAAKVRAEDVTIKQEGRVVVGVMEIPFKQDAEPLHVKLTAVFKTRAAEPAQGNAFRDFVNDEVAKIEDGTSVGKALQMIRSDFQQDMTEDSRLLIQLQQTDIDFFVVDTLAHGDAVG